MNKIIFIFLLILSNLFGEINEYKIDLYFGNGIATDYKTAISVTKKLNEILLGRNLSLRNTFFEKDYNNNYDYNTNLAYNNTFGVFFDFIEASDQKNIPLCYILGSSDSLQEAVNNSAMNGEASNQKVEKIYYENLFSQMVFCSRNHFP